MLVGVALESPVRSGLEAAAAAPPPRPRRLLLLVPRAERDAPRSSVGAWWEVVPEEAS